MKGLYKYLSPPAPDYSGAASVLFELGGLIVVCDAGGCSGIICGYDEPRFYNSKSAIFSAGLRDLDTIFGRDDVLVDKIEDAASQIDCKFIALLGTPVPAVIGTDFKALAQTVKKRTGLPTIYMDTNGLNFYDSGQEKAYMSLFKTFASDSFHDSPDIGIIGATPLDMPSLESGLHIISLLQSLGYGKIACYGMGSGLYDIKSSGAARCNLVVSPSGIKAAKWLKDNFGTPYVADFPLNDLTKESLHKKIESAIDEISSEELNMSDNKGSGEDRILIIHQQIMANSVRNYLREKHNYSNIDVATWFLMDKDLSQTGDVCLHEEDDLPELLEKGQYNVLIGDPMFKRAIPDWHGEYIDLPHYAVSGSLYEGNCDYIKILDRLL